MENVIDQVSYTARLAARILKEENHWVAACPAIDVMTQASTRKAAVTRLQEAVELWFESAIERDVLEQALLEANFTKSSLRDEVDAVDQDPSGTHDPVIEVSVPAYFAARLGAVEGTGAPR